MPKPGDVNWVKPNFGPGCTDSSDTSSRTLTRRQSLREKLRLTTNPVTARTLAVSVPVELYMEILDALED